MVGWGSFRPEADIPLRDAAANLGPVLRLQAEEGAEVREDCTEDHWQQDAFGQVDAWLRALDLQNWRLSERRE